MLRLLQATPKNPQQLFVAPAPLLESQPTLRQLKQRLVEAQLRASVLAGTVTEGHPQLVVARQAEQDIKRVIFQEVAATIRGVKAEIQLTGGRIRAAQEQIAAQQSRIERLRFMRAEYSNLSNTTSCVPAAPVVVKGQVLPAAGRWQGHTLIVSPLDWPMG
jgi:succinoglycan biosynthesis transport protein ExoP